MNTPTLIALGSLLVAALSAIGTGMVSRRQRRLEARLTELQLEELEARSAARAQADVRVTAEPKALWVANVGWGVAHDVTVEVVGQNGRTPIPEAVRAKIFPIVRLKPRDRVKVLAAFSNECHPPLKGVVRWTDTERSLHEDPVTVMYATVEMKDL